MAGAGANESRFLATADKGKVMSAIDEVTIREFHEFINAGQIPFPLCHGHALEIIAALNDFNNWNEFRQHVADTAIYKLQAKRMREYVKAQCLTPPLTISQARSVIVATMSS